MVIGPSTLNLPEIDVTTNQVVVNNTAVTGAGDVSDDRLCAMDHLLDDAHASTSAIAALRNAALRVLPGRSRHGNTEHCRVHRGGDMPTCFHCGAHSEPGVTGAATDVTTH